MSRLKIIQVLKKFKKEYSLEYGIVFIGLFGSVARDEATEDSDVDVVVKIEKQDLYKLIGIKQSLEEKLSIPVDLVSYRSKMNTFLKNRIDRDVIYV